MKLIPVSRSCWLQVESQFGLVSAADARCRPDFRVQCYQMGDSQDWLLELCGTA